MLLPQNSSQIKLRRQLCQKGLPAELFESRDITTAVVQNVVPANEQLCELDGYVSTAVRHKHCSIKVLIV